MKSCFHDPQNISAGKLDAASELTDAHACSILGQLGRCSRVVLDRRPKILASAFAPARPDWCALLIDHAPFQRQKPTETHQLADGGRQIQFAELEKITSILRTASALIGTQVEHSHLFLTIFLGPIHPLNRSE